MVVSNVPLPSVSTLLVTVCEPSALVTVSVTDSGLPLPSLSTETVSEVVLPAGSFSVVFTVSNVPSPFVSVFSVTVCEPSALVTVSVTDSGLPLPSLSTETVSEVVLPAGSFSVVFTVSNVPSPFVSVFSVTVCEPSALVTVSVTDSGLPLPSLSTETVSEVVLPAASFVTVVFTEPSGVVVVDVLEPSALVTVVVVVPSGFFVVVVLLVVLLVVELPPPPPPLASATPKPATANAPNAIAL